jgi:hypothetical protein
MARLRPFLLVLLLFACALTTYGVSLKVSARHDAVRVVKAQIKADAKAIRILKMELTYLASPPRVQALSDQFLTLQAPKAEQFVPSINALQPLLLPSAPVDQPEMLVVAAELAPAPPPAVSPVSAATLAQAEAAAAQVRAVQDATSAALPKPEPKLSPKLTPKPKPQPKPVVAKAGIQAKFLSAEALSSIETAAAREEAQERRSGGQP